MLASAESRSGSALCTTSWSTGGCKSNRKAARQAVPVLRRRPATGLGGGPDAPVLPSARALARLFGCLRRAGLDGVARTDPALLPGNYQLTLEAPEAGADQERAGHLISAGLGYCERKYHEVLASYRAAYDPAVLAAAQERAARRCLREQVPELAAEAPRAGYLDELRGWAHQQPGRSPAGEAAVECVTGFGLPWLPLADLAG
jgi:hypothetical protein